MKKILVILLLLSTTIQAQNISVKVKGLENWQASLMSIELGKSDFIKSITSDSNAQFKIPNDKLHKGLYRLIFNKKLWLKFIYDGKDINIESDKNNLLESLKVTESSVNQTYYKYLKLTSAYKSEKKKLQKASLKFPENDERIKRLKKKFAYTSDKYWSFINKFSKSKSESFIARYIRSAAEPKIESGLEIQNKRKYLEEHFWDNVDFSSAVLLNSDLYINKTIEYLNYFKNNHLKKDLQEKEYERAVNIILNKAKVNQRIYKRMTEYLINGFKKMGLRNVIDYIVDNFVITDDLCLDSRTENFIQMRINQSTKFKKNVKVPNIKLNDFTGKTVDLYNVNADKILILFYASTCPHCRKLLPKLNKLYSSNKFGKFEIYGISLDTDFNAWQSYIKKNKFNWINVSDLKGWKSKASKNLYIYSTPTMFLVDKNFKIIDRPNNIEDLKADLLIN